MPLDAECWSMKRHNTAPCHLLLLRSNVSIIPNPVPGPDGQLQIVTGSSDGLNSVSDKIGPTITNCRIQGVGAPAPPTFLRMVFCCCGASSQRVGCLLPGGATQLMTPRTLVAISIRWYNSYPAKAPLSLREILRCRARLMLVKLSTSMQRGHWSRWERRLCQQHPSLSRVPTSPRTQSTACWGLGPSSMMKPSTRYEIHELPRTLPFFAAAQ